MSTAETYQGFQATGNEGTGVWSKTGTFGEPLTTTIANAQSSIIGSLRRTCVASRELLQEEVPLALDNFCCFLEPYIEDDNFEIITARVSKLLPAALRRSALGVVGVNGSVTCGRVYGRESFPVSREDCLDPVIAHMRGWYAVHRFFWVDSPHIKDLADINLHDGMPEGNEIGQARVVLRVVESAVIDLQAGVPSANSPAVGVLGYANPPLK